MSGTDLSETQSIKQYLQHQRRLDLLQETSSNETRSTESLKVPQYILDARSEVQGDIEIIYLSSSDDDDEEDNHYDSDDSYHTANGNIEDIMEIDHDDATQQPVNESTSDATNGIELIEISSDDSDVEFLYEVKKQTYKRPDRRTRKGLKDERKKRKKASRTVDEEETTVSSQLFTSQVRFK